MVAPGAGFRGGTLFVPKIGEDQKKKGLRCKISGFSVQKYVKTKKKKKKDLRLKISELVQMRMETTKQSEKSKVFTTSVELCFHIMICRHPKMVTPGAGRPPAPPRDATVSSRAFFCFHH